VLVIVTGMLPAAAGCAIGTKLQNTQIYVQVSPDEMLHMAAIPRLLPDGTRPTEQTAALLQEVAAMAGSYIYIEEVVGGWVPPGRRDVLQERNDLLLVKGPPELALFLRDRLRKDFKQELPFVVSMPILPVSARVTQAQQAGQASAEAGPGSPAGGAPAPKAAP
jgi:hypothetical protein